MPEIHIDLFGTAFTWSGTEAEAADLLAVMREQAAQLGPADEVMESILLHRKRDAVPILRELRANG
jgi:hypothetical protein